MKRTPLTRKTPLKRVPMKRKRRKGDKPRMRQWYLREFPFCGICNNEWLPDLCVHHIVGGPGRKDDRSNLLTLCNDHHTSYHNEHVLTPGMMMQAKAEQDPDSYCERVICELLGRKELPPQWEPTEIPAELRRRA